MIIRRNVLPVLAGAGLCALAVPPATSQTYPNRPVKIIVPFAPGGVDVTARIVADRLTATLGQPFVIENRPGGAGGSVGAKTVAGAEPDGYTLLFSTPGPATIGPAINKNAGYDINNFAAVAIVSDSPIMLVVNPSMPARTVPELIAYARANLGQVLYPSPGYGTQPHLLGEMFKIATGAHVAHIPYRGSAPSITDLIAGQVHFYFDNVPNLLQHVRAGQLRGLALTTETRDPQFPELPTMTESGLPGFVATYWNGLLAPAATPASVIATLNAAINQSLRSPDMQANLRRIGANPKTASPEDFAAFIVSESRKWTAVAQAAEIKVD